MLTLSLTRQGSSSIWTGPTNRPVRKWDSVILPRESKEDIAKDVVAFLSDSEREWYASKGESSRVWVDLIADTRYSTPPRVS